MFLRSHGPESSLAEAAPPPPSHQREMLQNIAKRFDEPAFSRWKSPVFSQQKCRETIIFYHPHQGLLVLFPVPILVIACYSFPIHSGCHHWNVSTPKIGGLASHQPICVGWTYGTEERVCCNISASSLGHNLAQSNMKINENWGLSLWLGIFHEILRRLHPNILHLKTVIHHGLHICASQTKRPPMPPMIIWTSGNVHSSIAAGRRAWPMGVCGW